ncbi:hypothetical protein RRG08_062594 [Elysia crispata]|uniref:Uncharacterized protein n=1 Tax=Elysia crispata TaxID=231223 RepID=A0AAE0Z061_9GAST|nr:hypothetical protein RRG08_062594 [Elysia crispata]
MKQWTGQLHGEGNPGSARRIFGRMLAWKPEDPTVTQPVTGTNWWGRPGLNLRILQQHNLLQAPTGGVGLD